MKILFNEKSKKTAKRLPWAVLLACALAALMSISAAAGYYDVSETTSISGDQIEIGEVITPAQPPLISEDTQNLNGNKGTSSREDSFPALWERWMDLGYPANVAGVTQERLEVIGGEVMITHSGDEYTVLVLDDSDAAIAALRAMYTEYADIKVSFARSAVTRTGDTADMKYFYGELEGALREVVGDIESRGDAAYKKVVSVDGSDGAYTYDQLLVSVGSSIDVHSNRVVIKIVRYTDASGKPYAADLADELVQYYTAKYNNGCTEVRLVDKKGSDQAVWENGGYLYAAENTMTAGDQVCGAELIHVPAMGADAADHSLLYFSLAVAVLLIATCALFILRRRAAQQPIPAEGAADGGRTAAVRIGERELLDRVAETAHSPEDDMFARIMAEKNKSAANDASTGAGDK